MRACGLVDFEALLNVKFRERLQRVVCAYQGICTCERVNCTFQYDLTKLFRRNYAASIRVTFALALARRNIPGLATELMMSKSFKNNSINQIHEPVRSTFIYSGYDTFLIEPPTPSSTRV